MPPKDSKAANTRRVKCIFKTLPPRNQSQLDGVLVPFTADLSNGPGGSFAGTVRYSRRATKVRLIVDYRGVTIVMPQNRSRFKLNLDLDEILDKHLEWILNGLMKFNVHNELCKKSITRGNFPAEVPSSIFLAALDETWEVKKIPTQDLRALQAKQNYFKFESIGLCDNNSNNSNNGNRDLVVYLPSHLSCTESIVKLRKWLRQHAKETLTPVLLQLASELGLHVAHVAVKDIKSRWGSCSARNNINLSSRLLFLPMDLVRHVMLHELCHMYEMNHSPAFYTRLHTLDPDAPRHIAELRSGWQKIPVWASEPL